MKESCKSCKYGGGMQCRRHAPIGSDLGSPVFPAITDNWCCWCGDYEKQPDEQEDKPIASTTIPEESSDKKFFIISVAFAIMFVIAVFVMVNN